ncbi:hypothetical protein V2J09_003241 [Rumex salicifolius]
MVSLRRRRNLGLSTDLPPVWFDDEAVGHFGTPANRVSTRPIIFTDMEKNEEIANSLRGPDSLNMPASNPSEHGDGFNSSKQENDQPSPVQKTKSTVRDKKVKVHGQELSSIRGVYLKNMKWQAAIKVNKKQIHLGTLETPEEAAHLYDRAAFVLGREPNFELPEEDKEELRQLKWEKFLEKTKLEASCKRKRKQCDEVGLED